MRVVGGGEEATHVHLHGRSVAHFINTFIMTFEKGLDGNTRLEVALPDQKPEQADAEHYNDDDEGESATRVRT